MHPRHGVTVTVTELGAATLVWPPLCLCSCAVCRVPHELTRGPAGVGAHRSPGAARRAQ